MYNLIFNGCKQSACKIFENVTTGCVTGEGFNLWWGNMIPAHLGGSHGTPALGENSASDKGMGVSHASHKSLLKERSLLCMAEMPTHLLTRKLPCTLVATGSITMTFHPPCAEMSHCGQSHLDGPDGALTPCDLGWVFHGARARGPSAS